MGANVFTPGLKVTRYVHITRERRLPLKGDVVVAKGDRVSAGDVVARTELPGNVHMVNVSGILNIHQSDVSDLMMKKPGQKVEKDEVLAMSKGLFGLFKSVCKSPITGQIESVSSVTGQAVLREPPLPVEVNAYVDGVVAEIFPEEGVLVETDGTFIQGIFGIGPETHGEVRVIASAPDAILDASAIDESHAGAVLVVGAIATSSLLARAAEARVAAVVAGGIDASDLKDFLGYDLGVAITGSEEKGITLVTTEGFGRLAIADKTFELLKENEGRRAAVNGATQIRAGVMRPEILIPHTEASTAQKASERKGIDVGSRIRVIRAPYFGQLGFVTELPPKLEKMESETLVRVMRAKLASGEEVTVPRANVEMIEEA